MKKIAILFTVLTLIAYSVKAAVPTTFEGSKLAIATINKQSFIFNEAGVTFSVYQDGQFDFYLDNPNIGTNVSINTRNVNVSFNAGYNYDAFVQYDDYGAVVQIENTPIFYDYYGRISQAGNIHLRYNNFGHVSQVGGMYVHYNNYGTFVNYSGYINNYNRRYVFATRHQYFCAPLVQRRVVYTKPYRRYYTPNRCSFTTYRNTYYDGYYRNNYRNRRYYRPNQVVNTYRKGQYRQNNSTKRNNYYNDRSVRSNRTNNTHNTARAYSRSNASRGIVSRPSRSNTSVQKRSYKKPQAPVSRGSNRSYNRSSSSTKRNANARSAQKATPAASTRQRNSAVASRNSNYTNYILK